MPVLPITIQLVAGDHRQPIELALLDSSSAAPGRILDRFDASTWNPIDLSKADAIRLVVRHMDNAQPAKHLVLAKVGDYTQGKCVLIWSERCFAVAGRYQADLTLEWRGGVQETSYKLLYFVVRGRLS